MIIVFHNIDDPELKTLGLWISRTLIDQNPVRKSQKRGISRKSKVSTVDTEILRSGLRAFNTKVFSSEAVSSINYIGRQLDVSYIGLQMYGKISIYQI